MKNPLRALILGLITLILPAFADDHDTPETVATAWIQEVMGENFDKAFDAVYASPEFLKEVEMSQEALIKALKERIQLSRDSVKKHQGVENITIDKLEYSEDKTQATAYFTIKTKDGENIKNEVPLSQINGQWRIGK